MAAVSYEIKYSIPNLICDGRESKATTRMRSNRARMHFHLKWQEVDVCGNWSLHMAIKYSVDEEFLLTFQERRVETQYLPWNSDISCFSGHASIEIDFPTHVD